MLHSQRLVGLRRDDLILAVVVDLERPILTPNSDFLSGFSLSLEDSIRTELLFWGGDFAVVLRSILGRLPVTISFRSIIND